MGNIRVNKKEEFVIKMPTSIKIGDPFYFEEHGENFEYVYSRKFKGNKNWVGKLIVTESVDLDLAKEFRREIPTVDFDVIFALNEKFLGVYENNQYYREQKQIVTEIGVDTARYIIETNNGYTEISTGSDGFMGQVNEYCKGSKLEGVIISLTGLDVNDFEIFKNEIKYVFGL